MLAFSPLAGVRGPRAEAAMLKAAGREGREEKGAAVGRRKDKKMGAGR